MNKIKVDKKLITALLVGVMALIIGITVWILLQPKQPEVPTGGIDQGLPFNESREIELPNDIVLALNPKDYKVYKLLEVDHSEQIREFLNENGRGQLKEAHRFEFDYSWGTVGSLTNDYVSYNTISDSVALVFNKPLSITGVSSGIINEEDASTVAKAFLNRFYKSKYEFKVVKVQEVDRAFKVEVSRMIDGLELKIPGTKNYSDTMFFDASGKLLSADLQLVEYSSPIQVDMLPFDKLGDYINNDIYPKEYNEGLPINFDFSKLDTPNPSYGDAPNPEAEIPHTESCLAQKADLVYYFDTLNQSYLAPTYKIDCIGKITVGGQSFDVPVVVYANAIDPDFVYVPGGTISQ